MSRILLKTEDHSRDSAGMRYVHPVISRRAGGVSVGINLNPNNACNWRCIYCQVPDLTRGGPPPIDLSLLERELNEFLAWAGRETGRKIVYTSPDAAREAEQTMLKGSTSGLSPEAAVAAVFASQPALRHVIAVGQIRIEHAGR